MVPAATEGPNGLFPALHPGGLRGKDRQEKERSLYDSRFEHDACGVGFVADLRAAGGHEVVASALRVLCNLEHRGAAGADPDTGDGAGILTQLPDAFFRAVTGFGSARSRQLRGWPGFPGNRRVANASVPSPRSPTLPPTRA